MEVSIATRIARPTHTAKLIIARSMYLKGESYLAAAAHLRINRGSEYVVLHLICQGTECILKAILLLVDYDRFKPKLQKPIGHNLLKAVDAVVGACNCKRPIPSLEAELKELNNFYRQNLFRYGSFVDIFVDARSVQSRKTFRRIAAIIKLIHRKNPFEAINGVMLGI
jgi:hypothetical protein